MNKILNSFIAAVVVVIGTIVLFGTWYTIDQGERGVILRTGEIIGIAEPGLGWKIPFFDKVERLSVQSRIASYSTVAAYSRDQQPATMRVSVNYRLTSTAVDEAYSNYGSEQGVLDRLISPRLQQEIKTVFGQFNAVTAIQERERLNQEALIAVQQAVAFVSDAAVVESVQIENIDFSDAYEQSIEQRMLAEVEVQRVRQNLDRERVQAEIVVTQAQAQADAQIRRAQAEAEAIRLRGIAEAEAISARGEALRNNPSLVALVQAERWDGVLPSTMPPMGTLPIINVE